MNDETDVDELGPVDWIVVEFPGSRFNGEIAPALGDLVERDLIRVLDLLVLKKDSDGTLEPYELSDLEDSELGGLRAHEAELAMLLSEDDGNTFKLFQQADRKGLSALVNSGVSELITVGEAGVKSIPIGPDETSTSLEAGGK
jgi:hypothetical protein